LPSSQPVRANPNTSIRLSIPIINAGNFFIKVLLNLVSPPYGRVKKED
jgi:hypothetical protein